MHRTQLSCAKHVYTGVSRINLQGCLHRFLVRKGTKQSKGSRPQHPTVDCLFLTGYWELNDSIPATN